MGYASCHSWHGVLRILGPAALPGGDSHLPGVQLRGRLLPLPSQCGIWLGRGGVGSFWAHLPTRPGAGSRYSGVHEDCGQDNNWYE